MNVLPVVALNGLRADSLGIYLASLGLFSLVVRKWPAIRSCWRDSRFCLVGGPDNHGQVVDFVNKVGQMNAWTQYVRPWNKAEEADRKGKATTHTALWRALKADEQSLPAFGAHLALGKKVWRNPLLGYNGQVGHRKFYKGWEAATACIESPPSGQSENSLRTDLGSFLNGGACGYLDKFNAASWFGAANRIYNHGTQRPYREGEITPWAMALACEGFTYFAGGPSRCLGSRQQSKGAFPFVTSIAAPMSEKEVRGKGVEAEVWAPIWEQPMTGPELKSLFLRGRAELGGKGATTAAVFAAGVLCRGIDAGVVEFRRFVLLRTTSKDYFESRLATVVPVPQASPNGATTTAIQTIVKLLHVLPSDQKVTERRPFAGVRGSLERALVDFAAMRPGEGRTEQAWALVDEVIEALVKVDRNRTFRSRNVQFRLLPGEWATNLFQGGPPDREARLALAVSSMEGTPNSPQFIAYRLGVERKTGSLWEFPKSAPARRVWSDAELTESLGAMAERRIMDMEALQKVASRPPFGATIRVALDDLHAWLSGDVDEGQMRLWLDRLCVFDWSGNANREAARELQRSFTGARPVVDGALALYALFRPLASDWLLRRILRESGIQAEKAATCSYLARVIAMLRRGDMNAAMEVSLEAYRAVGVPLANFDTNRAELDSGRMLAALLIPVRDQQVLAVFRRWRSPTEPKEK